MEELRQVARQARDYVKSTTCTCERRTRDGEVIAGPGRGPVITQCWHCLFEYALNHLDAADAFVGPFATVDGYPLSRLSPTHAYICPEDAALTNALLHENLSVQPLLISVNGLPPAPEVNVKAGDVITLRRIPE
jgi:hypothetical protein